MDTRARLGQLKNELLSNANYASGYLLSEVLLACAYYKVKMKEENNVDTKRWLAFLARMMSKRPEMGFRCGDNGDTVSLSCAIYDIELNDVSQALAAFFGVSVDEFGTLSPEPRRGVSIPVAKMQIKATEISAIIKKLQDGFRVLPTPRFDAFCSMRKNLLDKYHVSAEKTDIFEEVLLRTFGVDKNLIGHEIEASHNSGKGMMSHRYEPDMLCVSLGIDDGSNQLFKKNFKAQFPDDNIFKDFEGGKTPDGKDCFLWGFVLDHQDLRKLFEMLEATIVGDYVNGPLKDRFTSYQIASGYAPVSRPVQTSTAALLSSIPTTSTTTNAVQLNKPMTLGCRKYIESNTSRAEIMRDIYQQNPSIFENCEYAKLRPYLCQITNEPSFLPVIVNGKNYDWNALKNLINDNKFIDPLTYVKMGADQITFNEDIINGLGALIERQLDGYEAQQQQSSAQISSNNNAALFQPVTTSGQQLEYVSVGIGAKGDIDFAKIDSRIIPSGEWAESYPASTSIDIPTKFQAEIIAKLQRHPHVVSVSVHQQNAMRY